MSIIRLSGLIAATLLLLMLGGCREEGPAERAGQQVDEAMEKTGEALDDLGEEVDEAVEEGTEAVRKLGEGDQ
jgi:hypothetical protein